MVGSFGVSLAMAVIMIVAGFLFSSVSGYMAGLVGSSNNPVSGITICTILFASLVLMWMVGGNSSIGAVAVVFIGAVVCNAAAVAGDNLQDLKAGQLIGATPWRQQVMLCIGVIASAAVMAPVMNVLQFAYGIGEPAHPGVKALPAPQANLVKSVAEGMFGGTLPSGMIAIGAAIGVVIIVLDLYLKRRGSRWSAPVLAVAVGIYLPLDVSTPILAGGIVAELVGRWHLTHSRGGDHRQTRAERHVVRGRTDHRRSAGGDIHRDVHLGQPEPRRARLERRTAGRQVVGGRAIAGCLLLDISRWNTATSGLSRPER